MSSWESLKGLGSQENDHSDMEQCRVQLLGREVGGTANTQDRGSCNRDGC